MAEFVLVHGAFEDRTCFHRLNTALTARGHHAIADDLPGHQDLPADRHISLEDYAASVCLSVLRAAEQEPPILVGHGMGALVASLAVEALPGKVSGLVHVAA